MDWLWRRYQHTPLIVRGLCRQTGGNYEKVMAWYRYRYRLEMEQRELLTSNNPFTD
mgnify:FL=1